MIKTGPYIDVPLQSMANLTEKIQYTSQSRSSHTAQCKYVNLQILYNH